MQSDVKLAAIVARLARALEDERNGLDWDGRATLRRLHIIASECDAAARGETERLDEDAQERALMVGDDLSCGQPSGRPIRSKPVRGLTQSTPANAHRVVDDQGQTVFAGSALLAEAQASCRLDTETRCVEPASAATPGSVWCDVSGGCVDMFADAERAAVTPGAVEYVPASLVAELRAEVERLRDHLRVVADRLDAMGDVGTGDVFRAALKETP